MNWILLCLGMSFIFIWHRVLSGISHVTVEIVKETAKRKGEENTKYQVIKLPEFCSHKSIVSESALSKERKISTAVLEYGGAKGERKREYLSYLQVLNLFLTHIFHHTTY